MSNTTTQARIYANRIYIVQNIIALVQKSQLAMTTAIDL